MKIALITAAALCVLGAAAAPLENCSSSTAVAPPCESSALSGPNNVADGPPNDLWERAEGGQGDQENQGKSKKHHDKSKKHEKSKDGKAKKHKVSVSKSIV